MARGTARVLHGGAPAGWLDFSANPNPLGTPAAVRSAVTAARYDRYANLDARAAEAHLAADAGVGPDSILLTAGATEALRLTASTFITPGSSVVIAGPTYGEYARLTAFARAAVANVNAVGPAFDPPLAALASALDGSPPTTVIVCDPNNPTGRSLGVVGHERVLDALRAAPDGALLVLDQSFEPFSSVRPAVEPLLATGRVLLVRSLTKVLAIPGIRVGYVLGPPAFLARMRAIRDPWPVGAHAIAAATAARWHLDPSALTTVAAWREELSAGLAARGLPPVESDAPFVLADTGARAGRLVDALARQWIAVRDATSFGLRGHIRIAVRPPREQERFFEALDAVERSRADRARETMQ